jgi:hypothetical protein
MLTTSHQEPNMTAVPENTVTPELMVKWKDLQEQLSKIKAEEMILRMAIYKGLFPNPVEGTNTVPLHAGWELKATRGIERKIDLPVLQALAVEGGPFHLAGIRAADLVEWKPELVIKNYRTLTAEQMAIFDQALTIKDGSPQLKIVLPAKAAKAQAGQ